MQSPERAVLRLGHSLPFLYGNMRDDHVIEVVTLHALTVGSVILRAIFVGGRVAVQSKSSFAKEFGNHDRVQTKGPRLPQLCDIVEEIRRTFKIDRTVQSSGMYVTKNELAARRATGHMVKRGIHGRGSEVVGDPFPQEDGWERNIKASFR